MNALDHYSHTLEIDIQNCTLQYDGTKIPAFQAKDCSIRGKTIGVIGHNGAGKSTFMKGVLSLIPTSCGKIDVHLKSPTGTRLLHATDDMFFCPEYGAVFNDIAVKEYYEFWGRFILKNPKFYCNPEAKAILDKYEISPLLSKNGKNISKGEKRRVQTILSFLMDRSLIVLDEPFDGLDVSQTKSLIELMADSAETRSFIVSSHRMDVIERVADTLLIISNGQIEFSGTVNAAIAHLVPHAYLITVDSFEKKEGLANKLQSNSQHKINTTSIGDALIVCANHEISSTIAEITTDFQKITPSLTDAFSYFLR